MKRVLAAIDNSAATRPVLIMGQAMATALGADLEVVHVVEDGYETASSAAEATGLALHPLVGDPVVELVSAVADPDVVAIVLGMRDQPGGPRPAGHLVLSIAGHTDKPVIVVPPEAEPAPILTRVLVAMEGSPGKARALKRTIELSADAGLQVSVVHVDEEVPSFTDQIQHETAAYAQEFFDRFVPGVMDVRFELRIGAPATEVLTAVDMLRPHLIAVGWPHSAEPGRGAVAREIVGRSPVPVMLVAVV
ncbi:MAG TPA: universal stress protein [Acidimicrobiales bacterium]